jgi:hypothetical protein
MPVMPVRLATIFFTSWNVVENTSRIDWMLSRGGSSIVRIASEGRTINPASTSPITSGSYSRDVM